MFRNPTTDLIVVLVIVLLIFGPKRLPGMGRQLGQGFREFKDSITGNDSDGDETDRPALTSSSPTEAKPPAAPAEGTGAAPVPPAAPAAGSASGSAPEGPERRG